MPQLKQSYKETNIKDIISSKQKKIAIAGYIVSKNLNKISIDDSTGVINAIIETDLPINTFVKVYGFLLDYGNNNYEIQGHFLQELSNINQSLYKKVKSMLS